MKYLRVRRVRIVAFTILLIGVVTAAGAADPDPSGEGKTDPKAPRPTLGGRYRFSSKQTPQPSDDARGGQLGPHGPAMDGVRGSAIGPAPGAFGTDASSPSDLRR